jgi:hypothetical protein
MELRTKRRDSLLRKHPKIHRDIYEIRFKPPPVRLSHDEFLVSVLHTNQRQISSLRRQLNGSAFYVKSVDRSPERVKGGHTLLVKLKRCEAASS